MPSPLITNDFLLNTPQARELFHSFAEAEPILDYHCHIPVAQIAENHRFADLAEIWLAGDHYKWRVMRANGVPERLCTGDASPWEKFEAYAATVPHTLRNPLYHWTHLELKRYFGIDVLLDPKSAAAVWREANERLSSLRVWDIFARFRVAAICTTDDPADSLDLHAKIRASGLKTRVYPAFRPDKALEIAEPAVFNAWVERLAAAAGSAIRSFDDFLGALRKRHNDFHAAGCRVSDHGLEVALAEPCTPAQAKAVYDAVRTGRTPSVEDQTSFGSYLMLEFGRWDAARGWTKQLHLGALRNCNSRIFRSLGPAIGFDSIGDFSHTRELSRYLDALDASDELPRTIIYNLNPSDNYAFAGMIGNFQDGKIPGKIQFGSGWWFLDQKEAMEWQLNALSNLGLLSRFVGMLTDSRSFLSYPRHEYFRRVLCNLVGGDMARGEIPADFQLVGAMVKNICFANARDYFRLEMDREYA